MIRLISNEEKEEWAKFPAKQYISVPHKNIVEEGLDLKSLEALKNLRAARDAFCESQEATAWAQYVSNMFAIANAELAKLREKADQAMKKANEALRAEFQRRQSERNK